MTDLSFYRPSLLFRISVEYMHATEWGLEENLPRQDEEITKISHQERVQRILMPI